MTSERKLSSEERFKQNDETFLATFYKENFPSLRTYVLQNSGTTDDAKDIFQDAMLTTWLNLKEGRVDTSKQNNLEGYVFQIAKNKWLDRVRSASFRKNESMEKQSFHIAAEETDEVIEERMELLQSIYGKLDEKCRKVLDMFYYKKMSLESIAAELNYDLGSMRTIKYRCMMKLRESRIKAEYED